MANEKTIPAWKAKHLAEQARKDAQQRSEAKLLGLATEHFGEEAIKYSGGDKLVLDHGGRTINFGLHGGDRDEPFVSIDFRRPGKDYKESEKSLQPGSLSFLRSLLGFSKKLKENQFGIRAAASTDQRKDVYEKALEKQGFKKDQRGTNVYFSAGGVVGEPEGNDVLPQQMSEELAAAQAVLGSAEEASLPPDALASLLDAPNFVDEQVRDDDPESQRDEESLSLEHSDRLAEIYSPRLNPDEPQPMKEGGEVTSAPQAIIPSMTQQEPAEPFYSRLQQAINQMGDKPIAVDAVKNRLKKSAPEGWSEEEWKWTKMDEALAGKKTVTRDELKEHFEANQIKVGEVV